MTSNIDLVRDASNLAMYAVAGVWGMTLEFVNENLDGAVGRSTGLITAALKRSLGNLLEPPTFSLHELRAERWANQQRRHT
jgi:hypothetical protein